MSFFNQPKESGEGGFWPKQAGTFMADFIGFAEGPEVPGRQKEGSDVVPEPITLIRWNFKLRDLNGNPVTYVPSSGENAGNTVEVETDGLSSPVITQRSKAGKWFTALLGGEPINFDKVDNDSLESQCEGRRCMVVFGMNEKNKVILSDVIPAPQGS